MTSRVYEDQPRIMQPRNPYLKFRTGSMTQVIVYGFILAISFFYLVYISKYSVDLLYWDSWDGLTAVFHFLYSGNHNIAELWKQHTENRMIVPYLLDIAFIKFAHYNIKDILLFQGVVQIGTLIALLIYARMIGIRTVLLPIVALIFLNLSQYQNILWSFQLAWTLAIAFLLLALIILSANTVSTFRMLLASACGVISSLSALGGILVWPAGLAILLLKSQKRQVILGWLLASLLVIATYLYHYQPIASTVGVASRLVDAASVTVSTNGALLLPNALFQSRDANLIAGSIWIAVQVIILRNVISLNKSQRRIYAFPFGLILVSLMFSVMVGIGRSTSILVPSRYSSFTLLGLVGVFVYLSHGLSRWKWSAGGKKATDFLLAVSLSVLITWTVLIGDIAGLSQGKVIHSQRVEGALALKQFLLHPNSSSNLGVEKYVYPRDSDWVRHQAMLFQSKHLEIDYLMVPRHP